MIENQQINLGPALLIALLAMAMGANGVAIKYSFLGFGVFTAAALRFIIASLAIMAWARITGRSMALKKGQAFPLLILSLSFVVQLAMLNMGFSRTHASRGTLLVNLQPFLVLVLAHFFIPDDRISKNKVIGLILGFTGLAFVLTEKGGEGGNYQIGDLMIFTTAVLWAASAIYTKRIISGFETFHLAIYPILFSIPIFLTAGFIWDRPMIFNPNARVVAALLYQGLVVATIGYVTWNVMLKRYGAVALHSFVFLSPVSGVLLGGLILDEPITPQLLIALVLIASGILVVNRRPRTTRSPFPPQGI